MDIVKVRVQAALQLALISCRHPERPLPREGEL